MTRSAASLRYAVLMLAILVLSITTLAGEPIVYQDGQYELAIPNGWHVSNLTIYEERIMVASPIQVSVPNLFQGAELPALIDVTISRMSGTAVNLSLEEHAATVLSVYQELVQDQNNTFQVLEPPIATVLSNAPAVTTSFLQDDTITKTTLLVHDGYMFRISVSYKDIFADTYVPMISQIMDSFTLTNPPPMPELKPFVTNVATVSLPAHWHQHEYRQNRQAFVSREEIVAVPDIFSVGLSMFAIPDFEGRLGLSGSDTDFLYQVWLYMLADDRRAKDSDSRLIDLTTGTVDGTRSFFLETVITIDGEAIQTISASTIKGNTLYNATFEAPVDEFFLYRPIYLAAINEMRWH